MATEYEILSRLLYAWRTALGDRPSMIRDAMAISANDALFNSFSEIAEELGEINRKRLGRFIARHQGRIVDGMHFERASGTTSSIRWLVK